MTDDPMTKFLDLARQGLDLIEEVTRSASVDPAADPGAECESRLVAQSMLVAEVAGRINDVLADHMPSTSTHRRNPDQSRRVLCQHEGPEMNHDFPDEQGWRDHVSGIIARALMKEST